VDSCGKKEEFGTILTPRGKKQKGVIANPLKLLVGDAGIEPAAFGSGDKF